MLPLAPLLASTAAAIGPITVDVEVGRSAHGSVTAVVDAPLDAVLAVVMDCDQAATWFPDLLEARVVPSGGEVVRCEGRTDLPWPLADRTWQIDTRREGSVGSVIAPFDYVDGSGNLDALQGRYVLEAIDSGRTRVTYEADVDLGFWVPQALLAWATHRILPGIVRGIEAQAALRT